MSLLAEKRNSSAPRASRARPATCAARFSKAAIRSKRRVPVSIRCRRSRAVMRASFSTRRRRNSATIRSRVRPRTRRARIRIRTARNSARASTAASASASAAKPMPRAVRTSPSFLWLYAIRMWSCGPIAGPPRFSRTPPARRLPASPMLTC